MAPVNKETLAALQKMVEDPTSKLSPWERAFHSAFLKSYGPATDVQTEDGQTGRSGFAGRYDKYYAPFVTGVKATRKSDLIDPTYKDSSPFDDENAMKYKYRFNEKTNRLSAADPFVAAGGGGLGMLMASALGGGIPGIGAGFALKHGVPLAWDKVKQYFANKEAKKQAGKDYYRKLNINYPLK
jgi:hypothetical protein